MTIEALLDSIAKRRPTLIDLQLERMRAGLEALGNPHTKIPPTIHVAGTNGKGSTIAYMRAILEASGARVHVFTSPHLVRFNERIVLAGAEISDDMLADVLQRCDQAVGDNALTFFEIATCAAFLAFSETPADYLLLEVGLGGRLDSTNVLDQPLATVVTPIALDHQQFLGDDLASIAAEKAGIFRPHVPAIVGVQAPEAMARIEQIAAEKEVPVHAFGQAWDVHAEHGRLIFQYDRGLCDLEAPRLLGAHQIYNAGLAVASLKISGVDIDDQTISTGLKNAHWPGRLQRLTRGPLVDLAASLTSEPVELWLDGGHNPHAGRAVAAAFSDLEERSSATLYMIAGFQANKDARGYFAAFEGLAARVLAVEANQDGAAPAADIATDAAAAGIPSASFETTERALTNIFGEDDYPRRILICGSLYLAGEVLANHS